MDKAKYALEKLKNRKTGYPVATVAYYGPDDQFASKVAVGIIDVRGEEPSQMRRWFSTDVDIRRDPTINREVMEFILSFTPHRVAMVDQIIGCPHEEGIDYPEGETCPQCPFWAHRNRWTGEILHEDENS